MAGRTGNVDVNNVVDDDESDMGEDASEDDEDFVW